MLAASIVVLALASAPAEPEPLPATERPPAEYELRWSAPAGCPDASAVEARIAALTQGRPDGEGTLEVEGEIEGEGEGYTLRLSTSLRGTTGTRELSARACSDLAESAALVVAVTLDPALAGASTEPEPVEPEPVEPSATGGVPEPMASAATGERVVEAESSDESAAPAPPPDHLEARPAIPRPSVLLRGGVGPELGALPGLTAALRLGVGLHWSHARLLLLGTYLAPRRAEGPGDSAALYQQGMVSVLTCARISQGPWSLPVCGGVEVGLLRADGRSLPTPRTVSGPWLGPVARVGVARSLGRVGLWLELEGVARAVGTRVVVDQTLAFRPSVGSLRALAGFEIAWR